MKIKGNNKANTLVGTSGDDRIYGFGGDDIIKARGGDDFVNAGAGDDTITIAGNTSATVKAGSGADSVKITANALSSEIDLGNGADVVEIAASKKEGQTFSIDGGKGNDRVNFALDQDQYKVTGGDGAFVVTDANGNVYTLSSIDGLTFNGATYVPSINPGNSAPVVAAPIADQTATSTSPFTFQFGAGAFTDVDGDTLTYTATLANGNPLPTWLIFDAATRTFSGTPAAGNVGAIDVRVTASDGTLTASDNFVITVGAGSTGGGGGGPVVTPPAFVNSYGNLSHVFAGEQLYAGKNNPSDGFALSINKNESIELGLDVRFTKDSTELKPVADTTIWNVALEDMGKLRFAYSAADQQGIDLSKYDVRLSIDTDGSENTNLVVFNLGKDDVVEHYAYNNADSLFDWKSGDKFWIQDDGGDAAGTVTQNVQALHWYRQGLEGMKAGDEFEIKLEAFEKGTNTKLAASEITINVLPASIEKQYGSLTHVFGENQLYAGGGNPATGFVKSVNDKAGIELGLDARFKNSGGFDLAPVIENGKETWTVSLAQLDTFRFAYSAAADKGLGKYDVRLSIDTDGTDAQKFLQLTLGKDSGGNSYSNVGGNSIFDWYIENGPALIKDDGGNGSAGTVTQNIQALQWYQGLNVIKDGDEYSIKLEAFDKDTGALLAGTEITIVIDDNWVQ